MITRVIPDAELDASVAKYTAEIAAKSASAISLTKALLYSIDGMSFEEALEAGAEMNAMARMTEDARRGPSQFAKRKPQ